MKKFYIRLLIAVFAFSMVCSPVFAINVTDPNVKDDAPDAKTVQQAMTEFKSLSKKEKRERFKLVKKTVREYKANKKSAQPSTDTLLLVVLSILLPPLAVYLHEGTINGKFWLDLILTLLVWLPGVIYALIVVLS